MNTYYVVFSGSACGMLLFKVTAADMLEAVDQVLRHQNEWGETIVWPGPPLDGDGVDYDLTS